MSADVDLDHVTIRFGGFTAVESVSLKISGGEFFSILGPSGCGKTTLLRTISGFLEPEADELLALVALPGQGDQNQRAVGRAEAARRGRAVARGRQGCCYEMRREAKLGTAG